MDRMPFIYKTFIVYGLFLLAAWLGPIAAETAPDLTGTTTVSVSRPVQASPLQLTITAQKEVRRGGEGVSEVDLISADRSGSGDVLRYSIGWRNTGTTPLAGAEIIDPVPAQTLFLDEVPVIRTAMLMFSDDGGRTYQAPPLRREVKTASGATTIEVPPASYTHVKWFFPQVIPPGEAGTFSFRVKVR